MSEKAAKREQSHWWKKKAEGSSETELRCVEPGPGHLCPECGEGVLDYNGLFLLTCDNCGYVAEGGACF